MLKGPQHPLRRGVIKTTDLQKSVRRTRSRIRESARAGERGRGRVRKSVHKILKHRLSLRRKESNNLTFYKMGRIIWNMSETVFHKFTKFLLTHKMYVVGCVAAVAALTYSTLEETLL